MQNNNGDSQQPVLIIAGMHRSGTSLTASLLQSAGLDIGQTLLAANDSNPKGHFENLDFFTFHQGVLLSIGTNEAGWTTQHNIQVPEYYVDEAKTLIQKNASPTQPWGWKDPRTTLFLDFWSTLIPEAVFLLVYRSPWEVLDSLYRRGDEIFHHNPKFALDVWMHYNQIVLDFHSRFPDKCLLLHLNQITKNPAALIELINQHFDLGLKAPEKDIYDATLLNGAVSHSQRSLLIQRYFPEADRQYQQLNHAADFSEATTIALPESVPQTAWLLKDWLDIRDCQKALQRQEAASQEQFAKVTALQTQLASLQTELANANGERQHLQAEHQHLQAECQHLQAECQHKQTEMARLVENETQLKHQLKLR